MNLFLNDEPSDLELQEVRRTRVRADRPSRGAPTESTRDISDTVKMAARGVDLVALESALINRTLIRGTTGGIKHYVQFQTRTSIGVTPARFAGPYLDPDEADRVLVNIMARISTVPGSVSLIEIPTEQKVRAERERQAS